MVVTLSTSWSGVNMVFAHDTTAALVLAADLVNSTGLTDVADLEGFLDKHLVEPRRRAVPADLEAVRALRTRFRAVWQATDPATLASLVNELLSDSGARPRLTDHGGGWGWHLHVTAQDAALEHRIAAQAGFAFADLVRLREAARGPGGLVEEPVPAVLRHWQLRQQAARGGLPRTAQPGAAGRPGRLIGVGHAVPQVAVQDALDHLGQRVTLVGRRPVRG